MQFKAKRNEFIIYDNYLETFLIINFVVVLKICYIFLYKIFVAYIKKFTLKNT